MRLKRISIKHRSRSRVIMEYDASTNKIEAISEYYLACCGLDCDDCDSKNMLTDTEAADRAIGWFSSKGWLDEGEGLEDVIEKNMYCTGCLGDRSTHWSPNCEIIKCCFDNKHLKNCSKCQDFPCELLTIRAKDNERYKRALELLRRLRVKFI